MSSLRILSSCLALLFLLADPAVLAARRPNVVFILTDKHGAWTLGCYGNQDIRTPNIDRLAAQGMLFNRAMSSNPVCSPTRATYLTGLIPPQHGLYRVDDLTAALKGKEMLREPFVPMHGLTVAFFKEDGAVIEVMQFEGDATEFDHLK